MTRGRGGAVGIALGVAVACAAPDQPDDAAGPMPPPPAGPGVVNDAWRIVKMATAHDVLTIEVEVVDLETASEVAAQLIGPLGERYAEVLVYVYAEGESTGGHVPAKRIQWTAGGGLVEIDY